ncbi:MAG: nicotinate phosphoribosyltransferase [Dethiobacteria bacterium]|jgi:nicotinate phosphoribosyltransferase|nr:nicotinate phosphoribosyltransferase [Bacillota bacterium]HOB29625.1 nicotinate phosphoribosyltransferase [Bacillota bacterium]HPZ40915.1 nicotinate phosphoribosyltransferase [Bacillota bacterium]HQD52005.1 nicotinate phosphoribosyltransferase [Bacillota bacterium]
MDLITLADIEKALSKPARRLHSASHEEIEAGWTSDLYFVRTRDLLNSLDLAQTEVTAEIFTSRDGLFAGSEEAFYLLRESGVEVWSIPEGETMQAREVVMRIKGPYGNFGIYETPLLGILASASGWATAARECKEAAGKRALLCFGARHVHPAVAPVMERAAVIGGADGCSCISGALLLQRQPAGTVPHAAFLIVGDSVKLAQAYDQFAPPEEPRIILVDTFKDEAEEALRVARALEDKLSAIRLDTPSERGGVTPALVREVRARLDQAGYTGVQIVVSGGLDPERISRLAEAGADTFGVGSYISGAPGIDMTLDLKEIEGEPIAKRGRIPGLTENPRLVKMT